MSDNMLFSVIDTWWRVVLLIIALAVFRYVVSAGTAFLLCYYPGLKSLLKYKIQQRMPERKQLLHELLYSLSTVFIFSSIGITSYFLYMNGYTKLYLKTGDYGWGYLFISLLVMIIVHDTYFYWTHRLLHTKWFFKHIHRVHHKSVNPTPLAAYSFHPLEALIQGTIVFPFLLIFPVHVMVFLIFTLVVVFTNVIGHLGFEFFPQKFRAGTVGKFFTFSTHHNIHHHKGNKNYGYYFTLWDKLMKTLQNESSRQKA